MIFWSKCSWSRGQSLYNSSGRGGKRSIVLSVSRFANSRERQCWSIWDAIWAKAKIGDNIDDSSRPWLLVVATVAKSPNVANAFPPRITYMDMCGSMGMCISTENHIYGYVILLPQYGKYAVLPSVSPQWADRVILAKILKFRKFHIWSKCDSSFVMRKS